MIKCLQQADVATAAPLGYCHLSHMKQCRRPVNPYYGKMLAAGAMGVQKVIAYLTEALEWACRAQKLSQSSKLVQSSRQVLCRAQGRFYAVLKAGFMQSSRQVLCRAQGRFYAYLKAGFMQSSRQVLCSAQSRFAGVCAGNGFRLSQQQRLLEK